MKKLLTIFLMLFSFSAFADDLADVKTFSTDMINHYQKDIFRSNKPRAEKIKQFNKEFVELFDMKSIIPVVLGAEYKTAKPEEIESFKSAFIDFNLASFAGYFDDYAKREFKLVSANPAKNKNQYFVKMEIINPDKADDIITLQWRFKKEGNTYKVIDAVISEVSMILNYKTEYANVIKQAKTEGKSGIAELTNKIKTKTKEMQSK